MNINQLVALLSFAALAACGGGGGGGGTSAPTPAPTPPTGDSCGVVEQKQFVADVTSSWYLWNDELADVDPADYDTPSAFLDALTAPLSVDQRDQGFSYVTTRSADETSFTSGAYFGFGFRSTFTDANEYLLVDVFEDSPADLGTLGRGNQVLAIETDNGFETIAELGARNASNEEIFGPNEEGIERTFRILDNGQTRDVTLAKAEVDVPAVARAPRLIDRAGLASVGYVHFRSFTLNAADPLDEIFQEFYDAGISDYVIDLRYNGGGLVSVAEQFLNLLGGDIASGQVSYLLSHNEEHSDENFSESFVMEPQSVRPLRIAFITTGSTASASELLINSLAPHVEVILVGEDTTGKAVGQYAFDMPDCDTRLRVVSFEILNGEEMGEYYTGLVDTGRFNFCAAADDVTRPFGDTQEKSLETALNWLNGESCSSSVSSQKTAARSKTLVRDAWELRDARELPDRRSPHVH